MKSLMDIALTRKKDKYYSNKCYESSTDTIICHSKKVRYKTGCYILYIVLLEIILLLIVTVTCYHDANYRSKKASMH